MDSDPYTWWIEHDMEHVLIRLVGWEIGIPSWWIVIIQSWISPNQSTNRGIEHCSNGKGDLRQQHADFMNKTRDLDNKNWDPAKMKSWVDKHGDITGISTKHVQKWNGDYCNDQHAGPITIYAKWDYFCCQWSAQTSAKWDRGILGP